MKRIGLYANPNKEIAAAYAGQAAAILLGYGAECCAEPDIAMAFPADVREKIEIMPASEFEKFADVVIAFGGDGTMLTAARLFLNSDMPLMGVNVGRLGFLAEFSVDELPEALHDVLSGDYRVVDRSLLEAETAGQKLIAFNEFVFEKKSSSRLITTHVAHNDHPVAAYRADGVIITTPTGSTAYSLSCGGPIITPSAQVLCITPISPHTLTLRPLIIPDSLELTVCVEMSNNGEARLVADGQTEITLGDKQKVTVRRSEQVVKLVKHAGSTYFDLLRSKLLWSVDAAVMGNKV
jgi:NAD+ kinase